MNGQTTTQRSQSRWFLTGLILCLASAFSFAQVPVDEDGNPIAYSEQSATSEDTAALSDAALTSADLQDLVGPIALYPDDLLAIVLPASTYPLEIVQAARFLELLESDSTLKPDDEWDESVVALLNYPDVIQMMNEDIDWTWKLGDAVIGQQADVIAAVETFRDRAYAAGNLKTDENQTVSYDEGVIEIVPVSEEIIYVPYYEPAEVVVYQPRPVYYYHPNPYPSYYYPYPADYRFQSRYFWGVTTAFSIGWSNHYLNVYHPTYWGHPYYGYNYYSHYYRRPSISVYNTWYVNNNRYSSSNRHRDGDHWRPRNRAGSRPAEPRVRNYHYPPGGDQRRRENTVGRTRLDSRDNDNGRMDLSLRQRSNADRNRIAARSDVSTNRQNRVAGSTQNTGRAATSSRGSNDAGSQRQSARRNAGDVRTDTSVNARARVSTDNAERTQRRSQNDSNAAIQFRDRSSENRTTNSGPANRQAPNSNTRRQAVTSPSNSVRTTNRATQNRDRAAASQRQATTRRPANSNASTNGRTSSGQRPTLSPSQPRTTARQVQPRSTTATRSQGQRPTTAVRSSAPRSPATTRSAPPRSSAPTRSAPPRSSAPTRSAPARSVAPPRVSAPAPSSSGRASSSRATSSAPRSNSGASQSRRGSSRPRNGN